MVGNHVCSAVYFKEVNTNLDTVGGFNNISRYDLDDGTTTEHGETGRQTLDWTFTIGTLLNL
jgi:hypothetical protein